MVKDLNDPTNRDSVPAMLTPGEFVINKEATGMYGPLLQQINNHGLQQRHTENQAFMNGGMVQQYNQGGLVDFIKKHEGWRSKAYDDGYGTWTIGYGRTTNADGSPVRPGQETTREAENSWIEKRVADERAAVENYGKAHGYDWTPGEIDALSSFRYNGGHGMLETLTAGGTRDMDTIKKKFGLYTKSGGKHSEGLVNRRNFEKELAGWTDGKGSTGGGTTQKSTETPYDRKGKPLEVPTMKEQPPQVEPDTTKYRTGEEQAEGSAGFLDGITSEFVNYAIGGGGRGGGGASAQTTGGRPIKSAEEIRAMTSGPRQPQVPPMMGQPQMPTQMGHPYDYFNPLQQQPMQFNTGGLLSNAWDSLMNWRGISGEGPTIKEKFTNPIGSAGAQWQDMKNHNFLPPAVNEYMTGGGPAQPQFQQTQTPQMPSVPNVPLPFSDEAILQGSSQSQQAPTMEQFDPYTGELTVSAPDGTQSVMVDPTMQELQNAGLRDDANVAWDQVIPTLPTAPDGVGGIYAGWEDATPEQIAAEADPRNIQGGSADPLAQPLESVGAPELYTELTPEQQGAYTDTRPEAQQAEAHTFAPGPEVDPDAEDPRNEKGNPSWSPTKKKETIEKKITTNPETGEDEIVTDKELPADSNPGDPDDPKTKGWLQEVFGGLLDKKELARAAVLFAGAWATGATPQRALAIAGSSYMGRLDAKGARIEKTTNELIKGGKYTTASINKFKKSQNPADLIPTAPAEGAMTETGESKTVYANNGSGGINVRKVKIGDNVVWVDSNNKPINPAAYTREEYNQPGTKAYDDRIRTATADNAKAFKEMQTLANPNAADYGMQTNLSPQIAGAEAAKWAAKNNVPLEQVTGVMQQAYQAALADKKRDPKKQINSLAPYLNDAWIDVAVGDSTLFVNSKGTPDDAEKVTSIVNQYQNILADQFPGTSRGVISQKILQHGQADFNKLRSEQPDAFEALEDEAKKRGISTFLWYLQTELANDQT